MNNIEQLPVGETFTVKGKKYEVVEDVNKNACWDCAFRYILCHPDYINRPRCMYRKDGKLVIFKELKNNKTKKGGQQ